MKKISRTHTAWFFILCAAAIMAITTGIRQTTGLFLPSLVSSTGLTIGSVSFAVAIGQLMWGVAQPLFGILADKKGSFPVMVGGALLIFTGTALTTVVSSEFGLIITLGIISAAGAGAGSFTLLFSAAAQRLPEEKRSFAGGVINAGGSFGQFVFAPLLQSLIGAFGWVIAMLFAASSSLLTIPLAWFLGSSKTKDHDPKNQEVEQKESIKSVLARAFSDRSYLCLHAGFFTCGFHVAFLVTHLPSEVGLHGHHAIVSAVSLGIIGLCNIAGSLSAGYLGTRYRMKMILFWMYASRAVMILIFLMAPKTVLTFYIFAAAIGFTWLATVPPTAGLVGKLFGVKYLATLFGMTLLTHQIGGFLGAWLGGIAMENFGNYYWLWIADMALALLAAFVNLPIREEKIARS